MEAFQLKLQKICRILSVQSDVNIAFVDSHRKKMVQYVINDIPALLKPYLGNIEGAYGSIACGTGDDYDTYLLSDSFQLNYIAAPISENGVKLGAVFVGPFLMEEPSSVMIDNVILNRSLPVSLRSVLKQYYRSITILSKFKVDVVIESLFSLIQTMPYLPARDPNVKDDHFPLTQKSNILPGPIQQDADRYLDMIRKRYENENELMRAVANGNYRTTQKVLDQYGSLPLFLNRVPNDPLRSYKNVSFVFNTLLRKAAENGGVHPIYIDSVSGKFAVNIEKAASMQQMTALNKEMIFEYCELVNDYSLKKYSRFIRSVIEYIRLNLDKNLSLEVLAQATESSPTSVSKKFKAETGESITDFINGIRIREAVKLMRNDNYNISDIALKVGFSDVNYFTKVFKKLNAVTPTEYRKQSRKK